MYHKPTITEAMAKVKKTIETSVNMIHLLYAKKLARQFCVLYGLSVDLDFYFPEIEEKRITLCVDRLIMSCDIGNAESKTIFHRAVMTEKGIIYQKVEHASIIRNHAVD